MLEMHPSYTLPYIVKINGKATVLPFENWLIPPNVVVVGCSLNKEPEETDYRKPLIVSPIRALPGLLQWVLEHHHTLWCLWLLAGTATPGPAAC